MNVQYIFLCVLLVLMLGTFSSVADVLIALDNEGIAKGFISSYLTDGEPYLLTAYGTCICAWDGTGHYIMYLIMLIAISRK